jgi:hypothetical protein
MRGQSAMSALAKRIGRPMKPPKPGKRAPLSLLVRADIKALVDERAKASGRTQAAEVEAMIERALALDELLAAMKTTNAKLVAMAFRRQGFVPKSTPHGDIWYPKGHPDAPKTGGFGS